MKRVWILAMASVIACSLVGCRPSGAYEGRVQIGDHFGALTEGLALVHPGSRQVALIWTSRRLTDAERAKLLAGENILLVLEKKTPCVQVLMRFKPNTKEISPATLEQYQLMAIHVAPQPVTLERRHFDWTKAQELGELQGALKPGAEIFASFADAQSVELPGLQAECRWRLRLRAQLQEIKPTR